jgi:predicted Kef-type K+ transport protein
VDQTACPQKRKIKYPINTALTVGASLAQIGEFSFILATLGVSLGLLSGRIKLMPLQQVSYPP